MYNQYERALIKRSHFLSKDTYLSFGLGVLSSLTAVGVSLFFASINLITSILIGLSVFSCSLGFIWGRKSLRKSHYLEGEAGLIAINSSDSTKIGIVEVVPQLRHSFSFWGISAKRTISSLPFRTLLNEIQKTNIKIRFLLFDPNSENVERKAKDESDSPEAWKRDISATIERIKELINKYPNNIELHIYSEFPIWRIMFIDESSAIVHYFPSGKQGPESPQLIVDKRENSLFEPLFKEFNEIWNNRSRRILP